MLSVSVNFVSLLLNQSNIKTSHGYKSWNLSTITADGTAALITAYMRCEKQNIPRVDKIFRFSFLIRMNCWEILMRSGLNRFTINWQGRPASFKWFRCLNSCLICYQATGFFETKWLIYPSASWCLSQNISTVVFRLINIAKMLAWRNE